MNGALTATQLHQFDFVAQGLEQLLVFIDFILGGFNLGGLFFVQFFQFTRAFFIGGRDELFLFGERDIRLSDFLDQFVILLIDTGDIIKL